MDDGNSMFDVRENTSVIKECSFDLERSAQINFFEDRTIKLIKESDKPN